MSDNQADLVILGGGSGGYAAALRAAELGKSVVLIEKDKVGGTCLHRGCIPTKALLHAGEIADNARESANFGVNATFEGIDMAGVHKYKDGVIGKNWKGLQGLIKSRGIQTIEGEGKLVGPKTVQVGSKVDDTYTGANVILATGSYSRTLPGLDLDGERVIASEHALQLDHVPATAIVLGGGVIGCEFASAWTSFGTEVTIVEALPHLVPTEDEANSKLLERAFRRRKINFKLGARFEKVEHTDTGVRVHLEGGETLEAELLLVAVGRGPSLGRPRLRRAGREHRARLRHHRRVPAHVGRRRLRGRRPDLDQRRAAPAAGPRRVRRGHPRRRAHRRTAGRADRLLQASRASPTPRPRSPRSDSARPQAVEKHGADAIKTVNYDLSGNGRSAIFNTKGAVKLVALQDGTVLGVHIVGDRVGELIAEAQLIYNWEALASEVAQLIHPHPTQSEAIGEAHLLLAGKPLHVHD